MADCISERTSWPMECPFAEVGCNVSLPTCPEYNQHLAQNIEQHLQMVMDLHRGSEVISPLQKLNEIRCEIEYLESTLENLGAKDIPALECIKTQMRQPDVGIGCLGDKVSFRLSGFTKLRESAQKWFSPILTLCGKYKLQLVVCPTGSGSGCDTHLSVALVAVLENGADWPIKMPRHLGVKVELMVETDGSVSDNDDSSESECSYSTAMSEHCQQTQHTFTWRPKTPRQLSEKAKRMEAKEIRRRVSKILPPWCQPPPPIAEQTSAQHLNSPKEPEVVLDEIEKMKGDVRPNDTILHSDEKFATSREVEDLIREFNSLVFQLSICLVPIQKMDTCRF